MPFVAAARRLSSRLDKLAQRAEAAPISYRVDPEPMPDILIEAGVSVQEFAMMLNIWLHDEE